MPGLSVPLSLKRNGRKARTWRLGDIELGAGVDSLENGRDASKGELCIS